jgi:hypothetical protein
MQARAPRFFSKLVIWSNLIQETVAIASRSQVRGAFEPPRLYKALDGSHSSARSFARLPNTPRFRKIPHHRYRACRRNPRVDPIPFQGVPHRVRKVGSLANDEEYTPKCASNPHPSNTTTLTDAHPSPTRHTHPRTPPPTPATAPPPCLCSPPSATSDNALTLTTNPP